MNLVAFQKLQRHVEVKTVLEAILPLGTTTTDQVIAFLEANGISGAQVYSRYQNGYDRTHHLSHLIQHHDHDSSTTYRVAGPKNTRLFMVQGANGLAPTFPFCRGEIS